MSLSGLYGILPDKTDTAQLLQKAESALKGGLRILQLRDKGLGFKESLKRAKQLRVLTNDYQATFIVNDSLQLAQDSLADGVHLGRKEMSNLTQLRMQLDPSFIIGVSCQGDAGFAKNALAEGASYLSFGAVYPSRSKDTLSIGLPRLQKARQLFPQACICAIGGISCAKIPELRYAGADMIAVISDLFSADDIEQQTKAMIQAWEQAR